MELLLRASYVPIHKLMSKGEEDLCTLHAYRYSEPPHHGGWLTNKLSSATSLRTPEAQITVTSLPYIQLNLDQLNSKRIQPRILNNIFPGKKQPKIESQISRTSQLGNEPVSR